MSEEIHVTVIRYGDRANLVLAYVDPVSGKRQTRSAKTANEKAAWKAAAEWEKELQEGTACPPSKVSWADFRKRYEEEHLTTLAPQTAHKARGALDRVERHLDPDRLCKVTASALSTFQAKLRESKSKEITDKDGITRTVEIRIKETTIAAILRHVKAALSWGVSVGMLAKVPQVNVPKKSKGKKMKGGALVGEQFDRMLAAVPKVRPKDSADWQRYLTGLWLSGLRLEESVCLSWDPEAPFAVDLSGRRPRFKIRAEAQKSGQDELLPMTPDFAELILRTPEGHRHGRVFRLNHARRGTPLAAMAVGKLITKIGKKAGVVVNSAEGKTASAHDLRRSFGTRWAKRTMPAVLRKLMRHASVETTMGYYVDLNVDDMADDLWASHPATVDSPAVVESNKTGNNRPIDAPAMTGGVDATLNQL